MRRNIAKAGESSPTWEVQWMILSLRLANFRIFAA